MRFTRQTLTVVLFSILLFTSLTNANPTYQRYRFSADHKLIRSLELTCPGVIVDEQTRYSEAVVWATPQGFSTLLASGFAPRLEAPPEFPIEWWNAYPTVQQVSDSLAALARRHPSRARVDTIGYSVQNRPLVAITIGNAIGMTNHLDSAGIMLIGTMHGNEKPSTPLLLNFAEWLLDSTNTDPRIQRLVTHCRIHILPLANPDGYQLNQRGNVNGFDLNRSFPCKTSADSLDVTTGRPLEVARIMDWTRATQPLLAMNFHTGSTVVNWPYDSDVDAGAHYSFPPSPDRAWFIAAADSYAVHNPPMFANNAAPFQHGTVNGVDWYQITGGLQDYQLRYHNIRHITVELAEDYAPAPSWLSTMWENNKNSLLAYCSLIFQGIDLTVSIPTMQPIEWNRVYADFGFGTAQYKHIGTRNVVRYLTKPGSYIPRVFAQPNLSSWGGTGPIQIVPSSNVSINSLTSAFADADLRHPFVTILMSNHQRAPVIFDTNSVYLSAYQTHPSNWYRLTSPFGSVETPQVNCPDSLRSPIEREWLLIDSVHNYFFPLRRVDLVTDMRSRGTHYGGQFDFDSSTTLPGTGAGIALSNIGWIGRGVSDSPSGNYANSVNATYTFHPITYAISGDSIIGRISFALRGNMESWFDYWAIAVSVNNGAFIPLDTITGIYNNWTQWHADFPLPVADSQSVRLRINVRTDGSVTRDGYTIDNITLTGMHYSWNIGEVGPGAASVVSQFAMTTYPNPANGDITLNYHIASPAPLTIRIYNLEGRLVESINEFPAQVGQYKTLWRTSQHASGIYLIRAQSAGHTVSRKVALIK